MRLTYLREACMLITLDCDFINAYATIVPSGNQAGNCRHRYAHKAISNISQKTPVLISKDRSPYSNLLFFQPNQTRHTASHTIATIRIKFIRLCIGTKIATINIIHAQRI